MFKPKRTTDNERPEAQPPDRPGAEMASDGEGQTQTHEIEMSEEGAEFVKHLQAELEEAIEARKRALADFPNYQRRALDNEQQAAQSASARVVKAFLPVLDHFDLALTQNTKTMTLEQLLAAVKILREEFHKSLLSQGVERIEPARGEAFDPHRHEAVMRQPADDLAPDSIVSTMQSGYAMGDVVLRPAKVAVAPAAEE
jgi:molecular chaperone GrpE